MTQHAEQDTIVALATPPGESALAVIRVSGPMCHQLVTTTYRLPHPTPRHATLGSYRDRSGAILDQTIFILYHAGASYTGDPMLEIMPHGNPFIARRIVDDLTERGCRPAEPGEFTRNAFLNGRIDLSQAEAIADLIRVRSDRALAAAQHQLAGSVGTAVNAIVERLLGASAHLEAYIDFPEEDLPPEDRSGPRSELRAVRNELDRLIATRPYRDLLMDGVTAVLVGRPNAGKSSLLNALLGEERVLVSEEPGTTRDYVESRIQVGSFLLRLIDTAGLHEAGAEIERRGMEHTRRQLESADVIVMVLDSTEAPPALDEATEAALRAKPAFVLENKSDLPQSRAHPDWVAEVPHLPVSAVTGAGIDDFRSQIEQRLASEWAPPADDRILVSARHAAALERAGASLDAALGLLADSEPPELAAQEVRGAIEAISEIIGRIDNERMLDALFERFCIGK